MGMGKSLSMLTLTVHTLHEAVQFSEQRPPTPDPCTRQPLGATLIVTPLSTIDSWKWEINRHLLPNSLTVLTYHGSGKNQLSAEMEHAQVVLTTYETLAKAAQDSASVLNQYLWFRVILDEAHWIRNTATQQFAAVSRIQAQRRWCLTGTPVQNGLRDIFALTRFLRFRPFAAPQDIRRFVTGPLSHRDEQGLANLQLMMKVCSIRRVKADLNLPESRVSQVLVELSETERIQYEQIKERLLADLTQGTSKGAKTTSPIFVQGIRQLRRICEHGLSKSVSENDVLCTKTSPEVPKCEKCDARGCKGSVDRPVEIDCGHSICNRCLDTEGQLMGDVGIRISSCPICGSQDDDATFFLGDWNSGVAVSDEGECETTTVDSGFMSSKVRKVVDMLASLHKNGGVPPKSIVFSNWRGTLDAIQKGLEEQEIIFARIDGTSSIEQRREAIKTFQEDSSTLVMLLTLGTGSVGLNLTRASYVHIVEPHWNPMREEQAAARAHRIGQINPVTVYRYIVQNSIEERVLRMQRQKLHLAQLAGMREEFVAERKGMTDDVQGLRGLLDNCRLLED
ncbi:hypothetical protein A1O3_05251 [Capronia epimyces CBS 606.96]|uniref:Adenosinetriphosphatase n=1 Tax=Capronia epimyces CBS 606.96 TaxID=1182542 RepID=W9Y5T2_9EURO|nr:uncharacterized protein A1O3_05251 [Capronia epimyces CBS 606.96]EXJ84581.1 hypothetical protein A1O3_05251 [Capronia epimyces CBS 606.96]